MKKTIKQQLRQKSARELRTDLSKKEKELVEANFKLAQGQSKDVHVVKKVRTEIAVIKTILTEKEKDKKEETKK